MEEDFDFEDLFGNSDIIDDEPQQEEEEANANEESDNDGESSDFDGLFDDLSIEGDSGSEVTTEEPGETPENEVTIDQSIGEDEFLTGIIEDSEDLVTENISELLSEYKFYDEPGEKKFRYIFDDILSKYWYTYVYDGDKESLTLNMYYRWLASINFDNLVGTPDWEKFIISDGNGKLIMDIAKENKLADIDQDLEDIYKEPSVERDTMSPTLEPNVLDNQDITDLIQDDESSESQDKLPTIDEESPLDEETDSSEIEDNKNESESEESDRSNETTNNYRLSR